MRIACRKARAAGLRTAQAGAAAKVRFAIDSPLEGDGFELPVPREGGHRFELSVLFMSLGTVRVLTQRSTLLGAGDSKSRSRQANGANSRSLENVLASAERPDGASGNRRFESISLQRRVRCKPDFRRRSR